MMVDTVRQLAESRVSDCGSSSWPTYDDSMPSPRRHVHDRSTSVDSVCADTNTTSADTTSADSSLPSHSDVPVTEDSEFPGECPAVRQPSVDSTPTVGETRGPCHFAGSYLKTNVFTSAAGGDREPTALTGGLQVPHPTVCQQSTSVWDVITELTSPTTTASSGWEPTVSTGRVQVPAASTGGNQAASPTTSQSTTSMWDMITELTSPFTASHNTAAHLPSPVSTNKSAVCDLMAFIVLHL